MSEVAAGPVRGHVDVVSPTGFAGIAYHDHGLCTALAERGLAVTLWTCRDNALVPAPAPFAIRPVFRGRTAAKPWTALLYIVAMLRLTGYVLWHAPPVLVAETFRLPPLDAALVWVMRRRGTPIVLIVHDARHLAGRPVYDRFAGRIFRQADHIICYAQAVRDELAASFGIAPGRVTVVPHGAYGQFYPGVPAREEARERLGIAPDAYCVLAFGHLKKTKGYDHLLRAFRRVVDAAPESLLLVAGRPWLVDAQPLRDLADALHLAGHIRWRLDFIGDEEVPAHFAAADVVVLPYTKANYSGVMTLAYTLGRPVVASRVGGLTELLREGETGLGVPPGDEEALAEALLTLRADPEARERMGVRARAEAATRCSWRVAAEQLIGLLVPFLTRAGACGTRAPRTGASSLAVPAGLREGPPCADKPGGVP